MDEFLCIALALCAFALFYFLIFVCTRHDKD